MSVLWAVLVDLWDFFTGCFSKSDATATGIVTETPLLLVGKELPLSIVGKPEPISLPARPVYSELPSLVVSSLGTAYVAVDQTKALQAPLWAFDTVVRTYSYATPLTILGYEGRFARVVCPEGSHWILKDDLVNDKKEIFPNFIPNKIYLAADNETKKLRKIIRDDFFAAALYLPLQGVEYVTYKLGTQSRHLPWPTVRPRSAGNWSQILKGCLGIMVRVIPKTGSVMEYQNEDGTGFVCFVEAVSPDDEVTISSIGRLVEGQYLEEKLAKEAWQALKPLWLQVQ